MTAQWSLANTRGFSVFPLVHHSKRPAIEKWQPFMEAPAAPSLIAEWVAQPALNVAVATGAISGCIVLDADNLLARIEAETRGLPPTFTVSTPRGTHFYFSHPGWPQGNKVDVDGKGWAGIAGLDLRGDGGYVVGPGSYFVPTPDEAAKGKTEGPYEIEQDLPIAPAPQWLIDRLTPKTVTPTVPAMSAEETSPYGRKVLQDEIVELIDCPSGGVSHRIYRTVARIAELVAGGEIREDEGWGAIEEALLAKGLADEAKANSTVHRAWEKGCSNPKASDPIEAFDLTATLGTRAMVALDEVPPPQPTGPARIFPPRGSLVLSHQMASLFDGCWFLERTERVFVRGRGILNQSAFDTLFGGYEFPANMEATKKSASAWNAFRTSPVWACPIATDICFRPELPPGQGTVFEGQTFVNIYEPIETPCQPGDASRFVDHVRRMLPNGRDADLVLHWMASCIQNPGVKFQWWPVIQGVKGNGKSLLLRVMMRAIGERYSHLVRAEALQKTGNQFNDWIVGKLFLGFEEIKPSESKRDFVEAMKDTVTNERIATEGKGKGQTTSDNRANGMMLTNHEDACPIDDDERRWGVFYCAQQSEEDLDRDGMGGDYFPALYRWLRDEDGYAVVTHFLKTMPLREEMDPATGLHRAPKTTSTGRAVANSLGYIEQEILEAIDEERQGFTGGMVAGGMVRMLLERLRKPIGPNRYRGLMAAIGYAPHPTLLATNKGRLSNPSPVAGYHHSVLYFQKGHSIFGLTDITEIKEAVEGILTGHNLPSNVIPIR